MQWLHKISSMGQKAVVKIYKSNKLTVRLWLRKVTNSLHFLRQRGDTLLVNVVSKKIQLTATKEAFTGVDEDAMFGQSLKNRLQVLEMLLGSGAGDEYVINVGIS